MKLSHYAKKLGITYRTAWSHFKNGLIPGAYRLESGAIIVPEQEEQVKKEQKEVCVYARVSSSQNKTNLDSQAKRVEEFCVANGWKVKRVIKEVASGLNDKRPQLIDIIQKLDQYDYVVIEHKDRLTRIGFNYFETFAPNKFFVINEAKDEKEDLIQDLVSIITSFCSRLYGQRKGKRKTERIIEELNNDSE